MLIRGLMNCFKKNVVVFIAISFVSILMASSSFAYADQWISSGPYGGFGPYDGGFIYSLAISSNFTEDKTIFAAVGNGFVYKSNDSGSSWVEQNSGFTTRNVISLVISPNYSDDGRLFAGTEDKGIFSSISGGSSWENVCLTGKVNVLAISPNFYSDGTVFVGTENDGIYKSIDGGLSWVALNNGLSNPTINALAVSPNFLNDQTVFAGTMGCIYKSSNGGGKWQLLNNNISNDAAISSIVISPDFANDLTVLAGTFNYGVYKSIDAGANWRSKNIGLTSSNIWSLAISPNYSKDKTVFAALGDGNLYKSKDGSCYWNSVCDIPGKPWIYSLTISPNFENDRSIFAGTAIGVYSHRLSSGEFHVPAIPVVISSTHPYKTRWYSHINPSFRWQTIDSNGVLSGYSYCLNRNPFYIPVTKVTSSNSAVSYKGIGNGIWYFHVRARDTFGNWGNADHFRIKVDNFKPKAIVTVGNFLLKKPGTLINYRLIEFFKVKVKTTLTIKKGKKIIKTIFRNKWLYANKGNGVRYGFRWNGRDSRNRTVSPGTYIVEMSLSDLAGNTGTFRKIVTVRR